MRGPSPRHNHVLFVHPSQSPDAMPQAGECGGGRPHRRRFKRGRSGLARLHHPAEDGHQVSPAQALLLPRGENLQVQVADAPQREEGVLHRDRGPQRPLRRAALHDVRHLRDEHGPGVGVGPSEAPAHLVQAGGAPEDALVGPAAACAMPRRDSSGAITSANKPRRFRRISSAPRDPLSSMLAAVLCAAHGLSPLPPLGDKVRTMGAVRVNFTGVVMRADATSVLPAGPRAQSESRRPENDRGF